MQFDRDSERRETMRDLRNRVGFVIAMLGALAIYSGLV